MKTTPKRAYALAMIHVLVTPERAAVVRERLKKLFAERQAAKADFAAVCARLATEPRSTFGEFAPSFEEIEADLERSDEAAGVGSGLRPHR